MEKKYKNIVTLIVFALVSLYSLMTNLWILWSVIVSMLFIDALVDSLKEWLDARQKRNIDAMKEMHMHTSENSVMLSSLQQGMTRIEQKIDTLEKKSG